VLLDDLTILKQGDFDEVVRAQVALAQSSEAILTTFIKSYIIPKPVFENCRPIQRFVTINIKMRERRKTPTENPDRKE
jgi:hypothetical protein